MGISPARHCIWLRQVASWQTATRVEGENFAGQLSALMEIVEAQTAELAKLRHLLSRNSVNSSMPPSLDDKPGGKPPVKTPCGSSARKKGKQPGAPGSRLEWVEVPDGRRPVFPEGVWKCGVDLVSGSDLSVVERCQQHELPEDAVRATRFGVTRNTGQPCSGG
jgi:transposase